MNTLYFFGDSWSSEACEVEGLAKRSNHFKNEIIQSYPAMVSDLLNMPYKNYSKPGSSQPHMIHQLLTSDIGPGDHAIFSLTAGSRRLYFDEQGVDVNIPVDKNVDAINEYQDCWQAAWVCYTLYQYCQQHSISCWFMSTFNVSWSKQTHQPLWNLVHDHCWILPKNHCVLELFDPEHFGQFEEFVNSDFYDWLKLDNQQVNHFIRPCQHHPNLNGRRKIAEIVAAKLSESSNTHNS